MKKIMFQLAGFGRHTLCSPHTLFIRHVTMKVTRKPVRVINASETENQKVEENEEFGVGIADKVSLESAGKKFSSMFKAIDVRKHREKKQVIYLEGRRLIEEALKAGIHPRAMFYTKKENIEGLEIPKNTPVLRLHYRDLELWSELGTPQGIVGFFSQPKYIKSAPDRLPVSVICDNVRDPSNLGAVVRSVAGAGCDKVLATKGCVDVWNARALRGSSGGHFKVPIVGDLSWSDIEAHVGTDTEVLVAVNKTEALPSGIPVIPYYAIDTAKKTALIVGGETEGVSEEALEFVTKRSGRAVHIPLKNQLESLSVSVATGIFLFHLAKLFEK